MRSSGPHLPDFPRLAATAGVGLRPSQITPVTVSIWPRLLPVARLRRLA